MKLTHMAESRAETARGTASLVTALSAMGAIATRAQRQQAAAPRHEGTYQLIE